MVDVRHRIAVLTLCLAACTGCCAGAEKIVDERGRTATVAEKITLDKVWSGHPVGFFLMTAPPRQYVAYYNADRRMVVAMRRLDRDGWTSYILPSKLDRPPQYQAGESSTILGWDSHNYITMALDDQGFVHLSGNMHCNGLTYFRSTKPYDITTLKQVDSMVGDLEDKCTYPKFKTGSQGELVFHYRHGESGSGNEIYNVYDVDTQQWSRLIDTPLADGQGKMNAYLLGPEKGPDGWFHVSWVWRNTPDCKTNHDLSYMKSRDLKTWYTANEKKLVLPVTIETQGVVVDPIPVEGGIINGSGQLGYDPDDHVVLAYHKFDSEGNTQAYCARFKDGTWQIKQLTQWDYRWFFQGGGSIENEVRLGKIVARDDGYMELSYSHVKRGKGVWLIDKDLEIVGKVLKGSSYPSGFSKPQSDFPGIQVRTVGDSGSAGAANTKYVMRWETLGKNRDLPRTGELPPPSDLVLYQIRYATKP